MAKETASGSAAGVKSAGGTNYVKGLGKVLSSVNGNGGGISQLLALFAVIGFLWSIQNDITNIKADVQKNVAQSEEHDDRNCRATATLARLMGIFIGVDDELGEPGNKDLRNELVVQLNPLNGKCK